MSGVSRDMNGEDVRAGDRVMVECEVVRIQGNHIVVSYADTESGLPMLVDSWCVSPDHVLLIDDSD